MSMTFGFQHSYARELAGFYARVKPRKVAAPRLLKLNTALAEHLGLDVRALDDQRAAAIFSGDGTGRLQNCGSVKINMQDGPYQLAAADACAN